MVARALVAVLKTTTDTHAIHYSLTVLYEILRADCSRYEDLLEALAETEVFSTFFDFLTRKSIDPYSADNAAFLLSGLMCRAGDHRFSAEELSKFLRLLLLRKGTAGKPPFSDNGRLDAIGNLLKLDRFRNDIWNADGAIELMTNSLETESSHPSLRYRAAVCVWLFTFQASFVERIAGSGLLQAVCRAIRNYRVEKVVRVCVNILINVIHNDDAVEIVIEENCKSDLTLLEFEKWRDSDIYEDTRKVLSLLNEKIREFSNLQRYCCEMHKGKLQWSILHTDQFWAQNVMSFEADQFAAIRQLVQLLKTGDPTTQAVACHDLGEFARLHPAGKKICKELQVKTAAMMLITSPKRELAVQALLCVQKLMLENWRALATTANK
eukprot:GHVT01067867.1.p1 GENE.GHVT01067867.1~~GHVT01067867.1.p1  ORF type:complete len:381 (+),score=70.94 GHVT01067867.1:1339-2481(+)